MSIRTPAPPSSPAGERSERAPRAPHENWEILAQRPFVVSPPRRASPTRQKLHSRRRARLRIWASLGALALLIIANFTIQLDRRHWDALADPYFARQRVQQCEPAGRTPNVLYLGSSRALFDIDPARVDDQLRSQGTAATWGCNAGMFDSTLEQDYYTLQRFIRDGYTPKLVVETLWEWNLNAHAASPADTDPFHFQHVLALAGLQDTPALAKRMGGFPGIADFAAQQLIPLYGDRAALVRQLCGSSRVGPCGVETSPLDPGLRRFYETSTHQGWIPQADIPLSGLTPDQRTRRLAGVDPTITSAVRDFTIGGQQPDYLAKMIALARKHGIRILLLQTPLHPDYYSLFPHEDDWQQVTRFWTDFAAAHGVRFFDASHLPGYTDADFVDLHHLQAAGAQKFSTWLATNVVGPALSP